MLLIERRDYTGKDQLEKNYEELDPSLVTDQISDQFKKRVKKVADSILEDDYLSTVIDNLLKE